MDIRKIKDKSNPNNLEIENDLWESGIKYIAGVDEAGRGPFAGPVVAGAVIMPKHFRIEKLTDSKKINKKYHEHFAEIVKKEALYYGVGVVSIEEINEIKNIKTATRLAMKRALESLSEKPDYLLIDGLEKVELPIPQQFVVKGDYMSHSISCAAIIAKTYRDNLMKDLDAMYDYKYKWSENAGYLTKEHKQALIEHGLTSQHRICWEDVANQFKNNPN